MQDNTKRGECTLFWMKILFILFIFLFFVNNAFGESVKNMQQESVGLAVAYLIFSIACGFGFLISSVMFWFIISRGYTVRLQIYAFW